MFDAGFAKPQGVIKTSPSDFIVREAHKNTVLSAVTENDIRVREGGNNQRFTLFKLTKRGIPAEAAYRALAKELEVRRDQISDCGMKDAVALTTQYIVVEGGYVPRCTHEKLKLEYIGPADAPLRRGQHSANYFSILVRTESPQSSFLPEWFQNYFGPQRFGGGNIEAGKHLLEGDIDAAVEGFQASRSGQWLERIAEQHDSSLEAALWSPQFEHERNFKVMQWRSHLWNQLVSKVGSERLPLWDAQSAWLYELTDLWSFNPRKVDHRLQPALFFSERPTMAKAIDHKVEPHEEGWRHKFALRSGSYATIFLATMYDVVDASLKT
tara:strand:- start:209 stop:1183 length:975 start_codon:yes stop_codon:yes gene_type:complete